MTENPVMRIADLIAGILFATAASIVLIPFFAYDLSLPRPIPWPFPFGNGVIVGGGLMLICMISLMPTKYYHFDKRSLDTQGFRKILIIGILVGFVLLMFANIPITLTLPTLIGYSLVEFVLCLVCFIFIPPQYLSQSKVNKDKSKLSEQRRN